MGIEGFEGIFFLVDEKEIFFLSSGRVVARDLGWSAGWLWHSHAVGQTAGFDSMSLSRDPCSLHHWQESWCIIAWFTIASMLGNEGYVWNPGQKYLPAATGSMTPGKCASAHVSVQGAQVPSLWRQPGVGNIFPEGCRSGFVGWLLFSDLGEAGMVFTWFLMVPHWKRFTLSSREMSWPPVRGKWPRVSMSWCSNFRGRFSMSQLFQEGWNTVSSHWYFRRLLVNSCRAWQKDFGRACYVLTASSSALPCGCEQILTCCSPKVLSALSICYVKCSYVSACYLFSSRLFSAHARQGRTCICLWIFFSNDDNMIVYPEYLFFNTTHCSVASATRWPGPGPASSLRCTLCIILQGLILLCWVTTFYVTSVKKKNHISHLEIWAVRRGLIKVSSLI